MAELWLPLAALVAVGAAGLAIGAVMVRRAL
jgi:hypothetical protein